MKMKNKIVMLLLLALVAVPLALAGSIEDECTEYENQCVDWDWSWKSGWYCDQYGDVCVDIYTNIDADTVMGRDLVTEIDNNKAKWDRDASGLSTYDFWKLVLGDITRTPKFTLMEHLLEKFVTIEQHHEDLEELNTRITIMEQFLINEFDFNPDDVALKMSASLRLNQQVGNTMCYPEDGICLTSN